MSAKRKKQSNVAPEVKASDYWATPNDDFESVFQTYNREFRFDWDACATEENTKVPGRFFSEADNSLVQDWSARAKTMWMNPPYSDVTPWLRKAVEEARKGVTTVALLKADHTTAWWKTFVFDYSRMKPRPGVEIRDWPKRIKFVTPKGMVDKDGKPVESVTPPWPNVIVIFRPERE